MRTHRYPKGTAPIVGDDEWVSQQDAARLLGMSLWRVGVVIANEHLDMAENMDRDPGVTRMSLSREHAWRQEASLAQKIRRFLGDIVRWF